MICRSRERRMNLTSPSNNAENSYNPQSTRPPCMLHNSPIWTKSGNLFLLFWGWPWTKNPDSKLVRCRMLIHVTCWWANVCKKHVLDDQCRGVWWHLAEAIVWLRWFRKDTLTWSHNNYTPDWNMTWPLCPNFVWKLLSKYWWNCCIHPVVCTVNR